MTAKLKTGCSTVAPASVLNDILQLPAAVLVMNRSYRSVPDFCEITTTSAAAIVELVSVKLARVVDPAAENSVIAPEGLFRVTPVVRDVS